MSYIGNARTLVILGSNVRDDLIPDPENNKQSFLLSQEVPGGYEGNVTVLRRRYVESAIVQNTTSITIDGIPDEDKSLLKVLSDQDVAAALSIATPSFTDKDASNIRISGSPITSNNGTYRIVNTVYNGSTTQIELENVLVDESGNSLTIHWGRTTDWEVLEPERDYIIEGNTAQNRNRVLTFTGNYIPSINDTLYVVHKGEATYNLVPSDKSVGFNQLEDNLKDFACDKFSATGDSLTSYELSRVVPTETAILVTVNGVVKEGRHHNHTTTADWVLSQNNNSIKFENFVPDSNDKIRVLHLGFTSGLRRYAFSPGQADSLPEGSVTSRELKTNSVTTSKIAPDSVNSTKLLIEKGGSVRATKQNDVVVDLIKLDSSDNTEINGLKINLSSIEATTKSLGTLTNKFTDLHLSGNINFPGNITDGTTNVDVFALKTALEQLQTRVSSLIPIGTIMIWTKNAPHEAAWLLCDGAAVSRASYSELFAQIGTTFGVGDGSTTFNLPDLRRRYPLGADVSDVTNTVTIGKNENLSVSNRTINHAHTAGDHTHPMSHTHTVPAHYHSVQTGIAGALNIASSGGHDTRVVISPTGATLSFKTNNNVNEGGHQHIVRGTTLGSGVGGVGATHTIKIDTMASNSNPGSSQDFYHNHPAGSNDAGSHDHSLYDVAVRAIYDSGTGLNALYRPSNSDPSLGGIINAAGTHSHPVYVNNNTENLAHQHKIYFKTGASDYFNGSRADASTGSDEGAHVHTVIVPRTELNDLESVSGVSSYPNRGRHVHDSTSFSGVIGAISGSNGNLDITTQPSSSSSTLAGTGNTGAYTPPHIFVNFIIKAKNI